MGGIDCEWSAVLRRGTVCYKRVVLHSRQQKGGVASIPILSAGAAGTCAVWSTK